MLTYTGYPDAIIFPDSQNRAIMKQILTLVSFILILTFQLYPQAPDFDLGAYHQFLQDHKNMEADELLNLHPAEPFLAEAGISWDAALYHDLIDEKYALTAYEKALLDKHGFLVTERLRQSAFIWQFLDVWQKDLPVFVSTDAILHAFHFYYVALLKQIEQGVLMQMVSELLTDMHQQLQALASQYAGEGQMATMLRDVDVYLTVPRRLLGENISPLYSENQAVVEEILGLIAAEQLAPYPFFSETCKQIDFSQFRPRGHYAEDEDLSRYFRAMMWLGRIEIYLRKPVAAPLGCPPQTDEDIQRQAIDAVLLMELMELSDTYGLFEKTEDILSFLVGEQDNASPAHLRAFLQSVELENAAQLLDSQALAAFQDSLASRNIGMQHINSQVLAQDPFSGESLQPAAAFMLFGQRFILDSYIAGNVVYSKIEYQGERICRLFPSTLDILFALGNDPAAQLLLPELEEYHYASNLAALRYLADSYDDTFWNSTVHAMWLNAIRALNPPQEREGLPRFMQTGAWWQQKMNTQLASWTELRHDHLLYAKQSYTDVIVCSYPAGYVEPIPQAFRNLNELAARAQDKFAGITFSDPDLQGDILAYFSLLQEITDQLAAIAEKELMGVPLDGAEQVFLQEVLFRTDLYGVLDGWYLKLLYGPGYEPTPISPDPDYLVADFHTIPSDCAGSLQGWVAHAGTGPADLAIVVTPTSDGELAAFAGPVASYYEYTTDDFLRLTDEEWAESYLQLAGRPDWVNVYMADVNGASKGEGGLIWTGTEEPGAAKEAKITAECFPNPFSGSAVIRFAIPHGKGRMPTVLTVYNADGQAVRKLMDADLPPGTYLARWDGANEAGKRMPKGVYFYELRCGGQQFTGKMVMM